MDHKNRENNSCGALREAYQDARSPSPQARAAVERKLRLRFAAKKEAAE